MDVHSGMYGGGINNPIHALNAIIASMRSPNGGAVQVDPIKPDSKPGLVSALETRM